LSQHKAFRPCVYEGDGPGGGPGGGAPVIDFSVFHDLDDAECGAPLPWPLRARD
jgi:hypothetical protein